MLISVAKIIVENKADFRGKFVFFFESDEEGSGDFDCSSVFKKYLEEKSLMQYGEYTLQVSWNVERYPYSPDL